MEVYRSISRFVRNHPAAWNLLHPPYILALGEFKQWRTNRDYKGRLIRDAAAGNRLIKQAILRGTPCAIGKIGSVEAEGLDCYLRRGAGPTNYPSILQEQLITLCGVFPGTDGVLDQFCAAYLKAVEAVDILAVWGNVGERDTVARHCRNATLIQRMALEPYHHEDPWSSALAGKRVLVIHPFATTIGRQMRLNRAQIWGDYPVLPDFTLIPLKMPLSPALGEGESAFASWFALHAHLCEEIERQSFDVALIGAGAMSLPLAAFIKSRGCVAIHTGGPTQILFGIRGRRWEETIEHRRLQARFNEYWTRPSDGERPPRYRKVEQGGYW